MTSIAVSGRTQSIIYANNADYMLASCGPIFIVEWRANTPLQGCLALRKECEEFAKMRPNGIGLLTIIQALAPPPGASERVAIAEFLRAGSSYIRGSAVVIEGQGFRAAFVRGVVTGLTLLAKQAFPHKVVSMDEAVSLYAELLDQRLNPQALKDEIGRVRARATAELTPRIIAA
jgi:hypothetical protein